MRALGQLPGRAPGEAGALREQHERQQRQRHHEAAADGHGQRPQHLGAQAAEHVQVA